MRSWFRRYIGDSPLHVLALLACFALTGYAVQRASLGPAPMRMAEWFIGAAVSHDLLLFPLYAIVDATAVHLHHRARHALPAGVPLVNHVRVPVVLAGLLLLVSFPLVIGQGDASYHRAAGLHSDVFLSRWLLATGVLFAASALLYAVRLGRATRRARTTGGGP